MEIQAILHQLTDEINIVYQTLKQGNYNEIAEQYNQLLFRKNEICQFIVNNKICQGTIVNVNNYGLLQVIIDNKLQEFAHKEIAMINELWNVSCEMWDDKEMRIKPKTLNFELRT